MTLSCTFSCAVAMLCLANLKHSVDVVGSARYYVSKHRLARS